VGASFKYADGSTLTSDALTLQEANAVMQPLVCAVLGITDPESTQLVRIQYPQSGAPFQDVNDDIVYLYCSPKEDPYDRIRDRADLPDGDSVTEQWNYTRAWTAHFCFYGPNSLDRARAVRSAFYQDYLCEQLAAEQLFPVSDFQEVMRVPEELNGQWFERCDFEVEMYEFVTETMERQTIVSGEVILADPDEQIADFTVSGG
jgi:hypothetical protein